jgi:hypothetical protein
MLVTAVLRIMQSKLARVQEKVFALIMAYALGLPATPAVAIVVSPEVTALN